MEEAPGGAAGGAPGESVDARSSCDQPAQDQTKVDSNKTRVKNEIQRLQSAGGVSSQESRWGGKKVKLSEPLGSNARTSVKVMYGVRTWHEDINKFGFNCCAHEDCEFFAYTGREDQSAQAVYAHLEKKHGVKGKTPGSAQAKKSQEVEAKQYEDEVRALGEERVSILNAAMFTIECCAAFSWVESTLLLMS